MPVSESHHPSRCGSFTTTHWSVVVTAGNPAHPGASKALEQLCRIYWRPIYGFVRRQGYGPHDAEDLTQGFFAWLLESEHLGVADAERGRFRSFLLCRLKHFLCDERKRVRAQKRGGGLQVISLDAAWCEHLFQLEPGADAPDRTFDRHWAVTVMEQTVARLRAEYVDSDRLELFEQLKRFQPGEESISSYAEVAARLGLSVSAVKAAIYRLRQRHGQLLREEIAQTVTALADINDEIRYLISVLSS